MGAAHLEELGCVDVIPAEDRVKRSQHLVQLLGAVIVSFLGEYSGDGEGGEFVPFADRAVRHSVPVFVGFRLDVVPVFVSLRLDLGPDGVDPSLPIVNVQFDNAWRVGY